MKHSINFRNSLMALSVFLGTAVVNPGQATEDPKTAAVEVRFIGNFRNKPVFELSFSNTTAEKDYVLTIRDEFGNSLYRETLTGSVLSKKFMVNTDEIGDDVLRVEVSSRKNKHTILYEINRNSHITEEVLINKIN